MPGWLKLGMVVAVIATVVYVLISPLPEPDAAGSIRSILPSAVLGSSGPLFLTLLVFSPFLAMLPMPSADDILQKNCTRLC